MDMVDAEGDRLCADSQLVRAEAQRLRAISMKLSAESRRLQEQLSDLVRQRLPVVPFVAWMDGPRERASPDPAEARAAPAPRRGIL